MVSRLNLVASVVKSRQPVGENKTSEKSSECPTTTAAAKFIRVTRHRAFIIPLIMEIRKTEIDQQAWNVHRNNDMPGSCITNELYAPTPWCQHGLYKMRDDFLFFAVFPLTFTTSTHFVILKNQDKAD